MPNPDTLLIATILLPVLGAGVIAVARGSGGYARSTALLFSVVTCACAGWLVVNYQANPVGAFAGSDYSWLEQSTGIDIRFSLALDGLSVWLFGLSSLLVFTCVLVSWEAIKDRSAGFYALLLLLETGMLGVFAARDIMLFYVFFEFTLIPLFFLIGIWGSDQRRYAAIKFFIFTLAGSMLTLVGLLTIVIWNQQQTNVLTFSIPELAAFLLLLILLTVLLLAWPLLLT